MKSLNGKLFGNMTSELSDKDDPMLQVMALEAHWTAQGHVMKTEKIMPIPEVHECNKISLSQVR